MWAGTLTLGGCQTELDDRRANSSNRGSREFSCASSVTSDEGCGTRALGQLLDLWVWILCLHQMLLSPLLP
ncbi:hypothetical protein NC652_030552 [Populus alba x Populus x berolinensis]|nr:hypothetical protein NC652_030552 [Populus alba x Populus x berolinensis]